MKIVDKNNNPIPVSVGDEVGFAVCLDPKKNPATGTIAFWNYTTHQATSFVVQNQNQMVPVPGQHADWIVERPVIQGAAANLAAYGSVLFQSAFALTDTDAEVDPHSAASKDNYDMWLFPDPKMAGNVELSHGDTTKNPEEVLCVCKFN